MRFAVFRGDAGCSSLFQVKLQSRSLRQRVKAPTSSSLS